MKSRFRVLLRVLATCALFATLPAQTALACPLRIVDTFRLTQSNGFAVDIFPWQTSFLVGGRAEYYVGGREVSGEIYNGKITGNSLHFLVTWSNGTVGIYDADIDTNGRLKNGRTYDRERPSNRATWTSPVQFICCPTKPNRNCATGRSCGPYCV